MLTFNSFASMYFFRLPIPFPPSLPCFHAATNTKPYSYKISHGNSSLDSHASASTTATNGSGFSANSCRMYPQLHLELFINCSQALFSYIVITPLASHQNHFSCQSIEYLLQVHKCQKTTTIPSFTPGTSNSFITGYDPYSNGSLTPCILA